MRPTLLLIRHSDPAIDPAAPASRWPLSPVGRARCARLAEALRPHAPAHVASSREPKAAETARLVAAALGIESSTAAGLEEHHRETVPFLPDFRARIAELFARPDERVLGEETGAESRARFGRALSDLVAAWRWPGPPCVVAHGTVLSLHLGERLGLDPLALWDRLRCPSLLVIAGGSLELQTDFDP
ncbi:MAG TPA: histidine phosphatase family protein [Kofleriaceae bacterium]|nr:histidine phosphatase family protein [Kofleriaceae bacterium]